MKVVVAYGYKDLQDATRNFSEKLGGGGFGSVFKGTLDDSSALCHDEISELIRSVIALYPFISMDIEFPDVVFPSHPAFRQPQNNYAVMKANVDDMHLIQVGLTFSDGHDNLPTFGTSNRFIWEFNFCEFDVTHHPHAPHSIALLQRQGLDFDKNRKFGVSILRFVELMTLLGLLCNNNI
ncbi:hypothetical protein VNO80_06934 [Phaseolus coccineus]|uniref:poly(A)-specific ribonuclease n=1 Tax=Phaseolus coccineus TaxID=3886 RepID=A0AAN9RI12_PHACN